VDLAVVYPLQADRLAVLKGTGAALLLLVITGAVLQLARRRPYVPTGWFWYLGTLVPVIGLVQVGAQSMADRYTYIPLIGLFIMASWLARDLAVRGHLSVILVTAASLLALVLLTVSTRAQLSYWRSSERLLERTLEVTSNNWLAYGALGSTFHDENPDQAIAYYRAALRINPRYEDAHYNLGLTQAEKGMWLEAMGSFREAVRLNPGFAEAFNELGIRHSALWQWKEAEESYLKALSIDPGNYKYHFNLGLLYWRTGRREDAMAKHTILQSLSPQKADKYLRIISEK
jgi:tetratricopeptide (TPR) repeat protein